VRIGMSANKIKDKKIVIEQDKKSIGRIPISRTGGPMKSKKGRGTYDRKKEKKVDEDE
jgi:hypothetical protein